MTTDLQITNIYLLLLINSIEKVTRNILLLFFPLILEIQKGIFCLLFYLFFSFIFISWRLITLQYCSGFCHKLTRLSPFLEDLGSNPLSASSQASGLPSPPPKEKSDPTNVQFDLNGMTSQVSCS